MDFDYSNRGQKIRTVCEPVLISFLMFAEFVTKAGRMASRWHDGFNMGFLQEVHNDVGIIKSSA